MLHRNIGRNPPKRVANDAAGSQKVNVSASLAKHKCGRADSLRDFRASRSRASWSCGIFMGLPSCWTWKLNHVIEEYSHDELHHQNGMHAGKNSCITNMEHIEVVLPIGI